MSSELRLECTSLGFPEQYDVFLGEEQVGYIRLRFGIFNVEVPDCGGKRVLSAICPSEGEFDDSAVRDRWLQIACDVIRTALAWEERQRKHQALEDRLLGKDKAE